jgi:hypothetical protein
MNVLADQYFGGLCGTGINKGGFHMKKIILLLFYSLFVYSCDKPINYKYYISNNCDENIKVLVSCISYLDYNKDTIIVLPQHSQLLLSADGINKIEERLIEYYFLTIKSKINIDCNNLDMELIKNDKKCWGALKIQEPQIEFKIIQFMSDFYGLFHYYGIINSNESFYITKYVSQKRNSHDISDENFVFKFFPCKKPDSTNQWIK